MIPPPLSLQDKLDRIAHEREVLALQRDLARDGLREGDRVRARDGAAAGRVVIARDEQPPRLLVLTDDGDRLAFVGAAWRPA